MGQEGRLATTPLSSWVAPSTSSFKEVEERVTRFLDLPEGWDSHGAQAINKTSVELAIALLKEMQDRPSIVGFLGCPYPVPRSSGAICLEWEKKGSYFLDLEVTGNSNRTSRCRIYGAHSGAQMTVSFCHEDAKDPATIHDVLDTLEFIYKIVTTP